MSIGSRSDDTLLTRASALRFNNAPTVDITVGGQMGHQSDLRYFHANTDYIRRNLVAKVMETPRGFRSLPDGQYYVDALKAMVEMHAMTWEGLNSTLTVNVEETAVSGAGEMQQTPSNTLRERSQPTMGLVEKYGLFIQKFHEFWQTELIMDPDTKVPGLYARSDAVNLPGDHLPDVYSMSVLFFEPDPTWRYVQRAWLCGNMFPLSGVENTGRRDKTADGEKLTYTIQFSALTQRGLGVNRLAQRYLDEMRLSGTAPYLQPAFIDQVTADVASSRRGYTEQITEAARTYVRP